MEGRKQSLSTKQRHTNRELLCSINVHVQTPIYSRFRQPLDFLPLAVSRRGFASPLARLADENRLPLLLQVSRKEIAMWKSKIFMSEYQATQFNVRYTMQCKMYDIEYLV